MLDSLLRTKLFAPPLRPNLIPRQRLIGRLNQGLKLGHKLTLISAPAGFGKTTLAAAWIEGGERPATWLSLDEEDNDRSHFLTYLLAALQKLPVNSEKPLGQSMGDMLLTAQLPPNQALLTPLLNEITAVPFHFTLVLDDYHLVQASEGHEALQFILDNMPPNMHLTITTRQDPPLPLARYRARGQINEISASDLRFTAIEAAQFLNQVMDLALSTEEVEALERRTEGWIAGLQMAALSMQGRSDSTAFIEAFSGSHRFVLDYLVEEVLTGQSQTRRAFLLQTSILERLNASLCAAVTGQDDAQDLLQALERSNLFIIPLDDQRLWYRYHHLFADVLREYLQKEEPDLLPTLHGRASAWYEAQGFTFASITHALAAKDDQRAAALIELARPEMDSSFQSAAWLGWVQALPEDLIQCRPVLSVDYAWALLDTGQLEACEARLQSAERWLQDGADQEGMVVVDQEQFRALGSSIACARAYRAMALADIPGTVHFASLALDLLPEEEHYWWRAATSLLGLAQFAGGDLPGADHSLSRYLARLRQMAEIEDAISITFVLGDIKRTLGREQEALSMFREMLQAAQEQGSPLGSADLYRGLSEIAVDQGDLPAAAKYLLTAERLGERAALTDWQHRFNVCRATLAAAEEDWSGALDYLDKAQSHFIRTPLPYVRPLEAMKARLWIKQGRFAEAWGWARDHELSPADELTYLREFEHITLARLLIAQYKRDLAVERIAEAADLLDRLLAAAEAGGRMGSVLEILILQALAGEARGDLSSALVPLQKALVLAEPQGCLQIFVAEGPAMAALLDQAARQEGLSGYGQRVRAALGPANGRSSHTQPLPDPLSERELEVLRLLATELSGPKIAQELMVSLNTMRTHTKNIYSKLGVNSRRSAVRQARELDLL